MRMQTAPTPMDRIYAIVSLDIMEIDKNCTGELGITRECGHGLFLLVRSFFF